jgi:hypothetical protein
LEGCYDQTKSILDASTEAAGNAAIGVASKKIVTPTSSDPVQVHENADSNDIFWLVYVLYDEKHAFVISASLGDWKNMLTKHTDRMPEQS